jgi:hypothetical protein
LIVYIFRNIVFLFKKINKFAARHFIITSQIQSVRADDLESCGHCRPLPRWCKHLGLFNTYDSNIIIKKENEILKKLSGMQ